MTLSEELVRIAELHQRGALTDAEFAQAKARLLGAPATSAPGIAALNAFRRSRDDRWLGGVCGGVARATGVESWIWRLVFALLALCAGTGVMLYLLMWILVPADPRTPGHTPGHPQAG